MPNNRWQALIERAIARAAEGCEGPIDVCCRGEDSVMQVWQYCDPCLIETLTKALQSALLLREGQDGTHTDNSGGGAGTTDTCVVHSYANRTAGVAPQPVQPAQVGLREGQEPPRRCDCGRELTTCVSCAVEEYQAAHPDCHDCCVSFAPTALREGAPAPHGHAGDAPATESGEGNATGPAATGDDTPLKQAVRQAFDHPTIANIEAVALAASQVGAAPRDAKQPEQWWFCHTCNVRVPDLHAVGNHTSQGHSVYTYPVAAHGAVPPQQ